MTTQFDDCIAEALRLAGGPPISIAILREHHQSAVYSTIWHLATTIYKLREAEAAIEQLRAYQQKILTKHGLVDVERHEAMAALQMVQDAMMPNVDYGWNITKLNAARPAINALLRGDGK